MLKIHQYSIHLLYYYSNNSILELKKINDFEKISIKPYIFSKVLLIIHCYSFSPT